MRIFHVQVGRRKWRAFQQPGGLKAAGLLAAWLVTTCWLPNDAQASCGDYLESHGPVAATEFAFEADAGGETAVGDSGPLDDRRPHVPCNGPLCRSAPEFPAPSAPAPLVSSAGDQYGLPGAAASAAGMPHSSLLGDDSLALPRQSRQRIERPPRVLPSAH